MTKIKKGTNVIIINDFDYIQGGASKVAIDTANILVEKNPNLNVYFFSAVHDDKSELNKKVIQVCTNQTEITKDKNKLRGLVNGIYNFKAYKKMKTMLKNMSSENTIIHVHGWTKSLSSCVFDIAFKKKYKLVLTLHDYFSSCPNGAYFNYKNSKICQYKALSSSCITCNCDSRNYFIKLYRVIRQFVQSKIIKMPQKLKYAISISDLCEKISIPYFNKNLMVKKIYNPIQIQHKDKSYVAENKQFYLYVGSISKGKGVETFCKVISKLKLRGIVVGEGEQKPYLEKKYPNIEFVGWKNTKEVQDYMKQAKLLIFPSVWYETAGLTILEAQSFGLPVLVKSTCAGVEFVPKQNVFIDDIDLENKLKSNNQFKIKTTYKEMNYENYYNKLVDFYSQILNGDEL